MSKISVAFFLLLILFTSFLCQAGPPPEAGIGFTRTREPNENAFTILVPTGWKSQGGIFRVNAAQMGGPLNALVAKCDLAFSSPDGQVMFHILPDIIYAHVGIGGGFWQPGSNYQGAVVRQLESAEQHLMSLFQYLHPQASNVKVLKRHPLPWEIEALRRASAYSNQLLAQIGGQALVSQFDAAAMMVQYSEGEVNYQAVLATGIVDQRAAMTWNNTRTLEFRAPTATFDQWRPVMDVMRYSIRFNLPWVLKETNNQRDQADFIMKVFKESNRIDQEMLAKSQVNREEIMNDNFLVLTGQEEFVNPHTGEVEVDTDAFRFRWKTDGGDVFYTNREDLDPNHFLQRTDYKRSPVRQRRN